MISLKDDEMIIDKSFVKQTIEERIVKFGPIEHHPEFDWGESMGNEMW